MIEFFDEIRSHFEKEYPKEGCGVLAVKKGRLHWIPCTNKADVNENFIIDSREYFKISATSDIVGIVHSHPDTSEEPSQFDIDSCNALGIPYYIFSYPSMNMAKIDPVKVTNPLMGREYKFGVYDCLEAVRDYYDQKLNILLPKRSFFEEDWWKKGLDYFTLERIQSWGFKKVENIEVNDALVFAVGSTVGNHCGVYIGNECIYHHAYNRLSCREFMHPTWSRSLIGIYRYAT